MGAGIGAPEAPVTGAIAPPPDAGALSPADFAELVSTFNQAAADLQATHVALGAEVSRLQGELAETRGQLRRARELAALGEMAAGIAHEIRNPLGSIKLYASVLVEDLADRPEERAVAGKVAGAVDRLNAVVGDVLAFARELRLRAEPVDAPSLLAQSLEACAEHAAALGVRLDTVADRGAPAELACDPGLLHQALVNIVRNAVEAAADRADGDPAGRVVVAVERRTAMGEDAERRSMAAVVVRDNGPGVPDEVRTRMFNPFFTTRDAGTGLGLAIVHRIMDAHSGRVEIASGSPLGSPGRPGAEVSLLLPESPDGPPTTQRAAAAAPGAPGDEA